MEMHLNEASIAPLSAARFDQLLSTTAYEEFEHALRRSVEALRGRTVWHINTTLKGGGVAEMLGALLPYVRGAGIACRWVVLTGGDDFLTVTKRIHNRLHGFEGDEYDLGEPEARLYADTLAANASALLPLIRPGDLVFVHDPQTAGLIPALKRQGAIAIWHCHIGTEAPNDTVRRAWDFLTDHVSPADRYIFSRRDYLWDGLDADRHRVIRPSIDAFAIKNEHLDSGTTEAILAAAGVVDAEPGRAPTFVRRDGTTATVTRKVAIVSGGARVPNGVPIVMQASRWDRLKDPIGVMKLFSEHLSATHPDTHLLLIGPSMDGVADDPEGSQVLEECVAVHASLPPAIRERTHLMCPPTEDTDEADAIVNAVQRRADVVIQKSLAEGFGLVVSEAMWKQRPVVAARVGGIQDQIEHNRSGILIDDPSDGAGFARAVGQFLDDAERARTVGAQARARVLDTYLTPRQLRDTMDLIGEVLQNQ